jgi:hypothetical protein
MRDFLLVPLRGLVRPPDLYDVHSHEVRTHISDCSHPIIKLIDIATHVAKKVGFGLIDVLFLKVLLNKIMK